MCDLLLSLILCVYFPGYSGTKYQAFSTGTLHVASVEQSDGGRRYRCQVTNILTKEKVVSVSWGRLKVVGKYRKTSFFV